MLLNNHDDLCPCVAAICMFLRCLQMWLVLACENEGYSVLTGLKARNFSCSSFVKGLQIILMLDLCFCLQLVKLQASGKKNNQQIQEVLTTKFAHSVERGSTVTAEILT